MAYALIAKAAVVAVGLGTQGPIHHMPQPPASHIQYVDDSALDYCGRYDTDTDTIFLTCRDRYTKAHEMGHVFDFKVVTEANRPELLKRLGFPAGTPWLGIVREWFADAYATCDLGLKPGVRWVATAYNYNPTARRHARMCAQIVAATKAPAP